MTDRGTAAEAGFDSWVEVRVAGLLRFAFLVTGSQQAAEDAVQSALASACEKWSTVSRRGDPDAYVRRMVVNAHISAWRRGRRELPVAEVRDATNADPAQVVVEHDAVWRVCVALPPQQRAAVVLRFYEDLEYDEIATILGVAVPTVRSHVHRALAALRRELGAEEDE
ncbi:SigE family RNA polymerase sigma factor [Nocardioides sp. HM23]|uniref:SigE family RNA polymerase sigma factor n=1 Tax=Nocardioides bizhenqiangii TaxID=3095076 RepID=UPI002ACAFB2F|nr:SigE family RNA polymerase sigma factor [Nocardioides sp. HM23]MDZ5620798.1 SigE family RNA polymerase sigma factor [Nocardioides sp. HM23]